MDDEDENDVDFDHRNDCYNTAVPCSEGVRL